jgi:two-component sensor histidine kinase
VAIEREITEQKRVQEQTEQSLKEKEILLAEIHHRVKNNLAVVNSLLHLQMDEAEDPHVKSQLVESATRIRSMASIHEQLYQSKNFSELDLSVNLQNLVDELRRMTVYQNNIEFKFNLDSVYLSMNEAIPCSLIANEVLTNVLKHAFIDQMSGEVDIHLRQENQGEVQLSVEDNGVGMEQNRSETSLGMELIEVLTEQLNGESQYASTDRGTRFELRFKPTS